MLKARETEFLKVFKSNGGKSLSDILHSLLWGHVWFLAHRHTWSADLCDLEGQAAETYKEILKNPKMHKQTNLKAVKPTN